ncbi:hypothetical protein JTB14_027991 [Gonioctena quinquepunctata]|nr:hypothetical protein JTB14_027991 [Gonioctena quinquepunctata]
MLKFLGNSECMETISKCFPEHTHTNQCIDSKYDTSEELLNTENFYEQVEPTYENNSTNFEYDYDNAQQGEYSDNFPEDQTINEET